MLTIYTYAACGTCRRARQWLRARGVPFTERPIREQPPSLGELRAMLEARGGDLRRFLPQVPRSTWRPFSGPESCYLPRGLVVSECRSRLPSLRCLSVLWSIHTLNQPNLNHTVCTPERCTSSVDN